MKPPVTKTPVQPGQRFVAVGAPAIVWEAVQVMEREGESSRHILLKLSMHRHRLKTLSESALLDPRHYRRAD
jgi:hypothetical protein